VLRAAAPDQTCPGRAWSLGDDLGGGWARDVRLWSRAHRRSASRHLAADRDPRHLPAPMIGALLRILMYPFGTRSRVREARRSCPSERHVPYSLGIRGMELAGLEPATSWVRSRRSPN